MPEELTLAHDEEVIKPLSPEVAGWLSDIQKKATKIKNVITEGSTRLHDRNDIEQLGYANIQCLKVAELVTEIQTGGSTWTNDVLDSAMNHLDSEMGQLERLFIPVKDVLVSNGYEVDTVDFVATRPKPEVLEISDMSSEETIEEGTVLNTDEGLDEYFIKAGFQSDSSVEDTSNEVSTLTGAEVLESDILQSWSAPNYVTMGRALDSFQILDKWKSGDPQLFSTSWWNKLGQIRRDITLVLSLAGYSQEEVATFQGEVVSLWAEQVDKKRKGMDKDTKWSKLSEQILRHVAEKLSGRELDPNNLQLQNGESNQSTLDSIKDTDREVLITPETLPEVERMLEREQFKFTHLSAELKDMQAAATDISQGKLLMESLAQMAEKDTTVALKMKQKYLKTLLVLNERLHLYLPEEESASEPAREVESPAEPVVSAAESTVPNADVKATAVVEPSEANNTASPESGAPLVSPMETATYAEANSERAAAREAFVGARDTYYTALREFYQGKIDGQGQVVAEKEQGGRRLAYKVREFFGSANELPPHLKVLKEQHDQLQVVYAQKLDAALLVRATSNENNRAYNSLQDEGTKKAFADRFIAKSALLTMSAREGEKKESSKFVGAVKRVAAHMRNHKWLVRAGLITTYSLLGAATGGVGTAAVMGGRYAVGIAAGAAGGAAGGTLGKMAFNRSVETAKATVDKTLAKQASEFSFSNFADAQAEYGKAYGTLRRKEIMQGTAGIAGALVGGFVAGRGSAEAFTTALDGGVAEVPQQHMAAEAPKPVVEGMFPNQPLIQTSVVVERFGPGGESLPGIEAAGINLEGSRVTSLSAATLTETDRVMPSVIESVKLSVKDLLEARPNLPKSEVEQIVFERMEAKYGSETWWKEAGITKLSIESLEVAVPTSTVPEPATSAEPSAAPESATPTTPTEPSAAPESVETPKTHAVVSGDTLSGIVKQEYAHLFKDMSPADQNRALGELFERVRTDAALRDSIGLKSGNADRIYVGEQLALDALGAELKSMLEVGPGRPRTGALVVDSSLGTEVETIPIKEVVRSPINEAYIDAGSIGGYREQTEFDTQSSTRGTGAALNAAGLESYRVPRPEIGFVASGSYFESPQYRSFLAENGVSPELVTDATKKFAVEFEGKTYSWLNEFLQKFDSPYSELRTMTLQELDALRKEAGDSEEALRVLLSEQASREAVEQGRVAGSDAPKTFNLPTVRAWDSLIDSIRQKEGFVFNQNTTVDDLVKRYVAEQMIKNNYDARFKAASK